MLRAALDIRGWSPEAAVAFAVRARRSRSKVTLSSGKTVIDAKELVDVLALRSVRGADVMLEVTGVDEQKAFGTLLAQLSSVVGPNIDSEERVREQVLAPAYCVAPNTLAQLPSVGDFWRRLLDAWRRIPDLRPGRTEPLPAMRLGESQSVRKRPEALREIVRHFSESPRQEAGYYAFAAGLVRTLQHKCSDREMTEWLGRQLTRAQALGLPPDTLQRIAVEVVIRLKSTGDL